MNHDEVSLEHPDGWAAFENIAQFLDVDGWSPDPIDGLTAFSARYIGHNTEIRVVAHVNVELEQLYCYAIPPVTAPPERLAEVAEFITRANYGFRIGNFECDLRDGEIRYKASVDFEGVGLNHSQIRTAIYPAVQTVDRYYPGLVKVVSESVSAVDAISEIETGS